MTRDILSHMSLRAGFNYIQCLDEFIITSEWKHTKSQARAMATPDYFNCWRDRCLGGDLSLAPAYIIFCNLGDSG